MGASLLRPWAGGRLARTSREPPKKEVRQRPLRSPAGDGAAREQPPLSVRLDVRSLPGTGGRCAAAEKPELLRCADLDHHERQVVELRRSGLKGREIRENGIADRRRLGVPRQAAE